MAMSVSQSKPTPNKENAMPPTPRKTAVKKTAAKKAAVRKPTGLDVRKTAPAKKTVSQTRVERDEKRVAAKQAEVRKPRNVDSETVITFGRVFPVKDISGEWVESCRRAARDLFSAPVSANVEVSDEAEGQETVVVTFKQARGLPSQVH